MIELLKGRISDADGLSEVLEIIATFKEVSSAILEVETGGMSGRIGIAWGKYITGAVISEPSMKGRKALRKLLRAREGKFRFVDLESEPPIVELRQQLGIDLTRTATVVPRLDPGSAIFLWDSNEDPREEEQDEDKGQGAEVKKTEATAAEATATTAAEVTTATAADATAATPAELTQMSAEALKVLSEATLELPANFGSCSEPSSTSSTYSPPEPKAEAVPLEYELTSPNLDQVLNEMVHKELEATLQVPPAPADDEPILPVHPDLEVEDPNETGLLPNPRVFDDSVQPPPDSWASRAMANASIKKPPPVSAILKSLPDPRNVDEPEPFAEARDPDQPVLPVGSDVALDAEMPVPEPALEGEAQPFVLPAKQMEFPTVPALDAIFGPSTESNPALPASSMPPPPAFAGSAPPIWKKETEDPFALKGNFGLLTEPVKPFETEPDLPTPTSVVEEDDWDKAVRSAASAAVRQEQPTENRLNTLRSRYAESTEPPPPPAPVRGAPLLQPAVVADNNFIPQQFIDPPGRLRPQPAHDSGSIGIAVFCVLLFVVSCAGTVVLGPRAWEFITSVLHLS